MSEENKRITTILKLDDKRVYFYPVKQFPVSSNEKDIMKRVIDTIVQEYKLRKQNLFLEVMLRQKHLYTGLLDTFVTHAPEWMPKQGLGIVPERPVTKFPTADDLKDVDPRKILQKGILSTVDVPEFVFNISNDKGKEAGVELMTGHGAFYMMLTTLKQQELHQKWNEIFREKVTDPQMKRMPLFIPLLGVNSFVNTSNEELLSWFEFFDLFIGESFDDKGIVITTKNNIDDVIEKLSMTLPDIEIDKEAEILRW